MGGDGGTVAANRKWLRGAGAASHTADAKRGGRASAEGERERLLQTMTTCHITGATLLCMLPRETTTVVSDAYGRLYAREAAVEALIRRREAPAATSSAASPTGAEAAEPDIGWHVRGLKDLHPVRFQVTRRGDAATGSHIAVCPLTGVELNGSTPALLIVQRKAGKDDGDRFAARVGPNVLSERAIREVGVGDLQAEYGPFEYPADCIRLAPPASELDKIKQHLDARRKKERKEKRDKKGKDGERDAKKRKKERKGKAESGPTMRGKAVAVENARSASASGSGGSTVAVVARANVAAAVATSSALSSLFSDRGKGSTPADERAKNLFSRNC